MTQDDLAYEISTDGNARLLYWDTKEKKISDNRTYFGQYKLAKTNDKDKFSGLGTIKYPDGSKYQGMTKDGKYHGKGRMTHSNGDIYHGEWENGKAQGKGVFLDKNGCMYDGEWREDVYHGKGEEHWDYSNIKYTGDFIEG